MVVARQIRGAIVASAAALALLTTPQIGADTGSCSICRDCTPTCKCPPSSTPFKVCCGAGGGASCSFECSTFGDACTGGVICSQVCPGAHSATSSRCNASCSVGLLSPTGYRILTASLGAQNATFGLTRVAGLALVRAFGRRSCFAAASARVQSPIQDSGPGRFSARPSVDFPGMYEYAVAFDKPASAFLLDVVFTDDLGNTSSLRTKYDNYLGEGRAIISGVFARVSAPERLASIKGVVRYVEYEDGTTAGDLDQFTALQEFQPLRKAVRAAALRYARLAREGGIGLVQTALAADQAIDKRARSREQRLAIQQIAVEMRATPDLTRLIGRLEAMASRQ